MNANSNVQEVFKAPFMDWQTRLSYSQKVRPARVAQGLSQDELAEMAGVSRGTVMNLESGKSAPQADKLWRILLALDIAPGRDNEWPVYVEEYLRLIAPLITAITDEKRRGEVMGKVIMMLGEGAQGQTRG
ncbi:helix-turn-helix transcriptional regulator [Cryobacterium sp. 10I1]|uniref:helix-turn-helix domain-containing protein n=1 Tax=Cryobacterium sp. 10I1 TaxID=3048578 RepID=UPI002B222BEC|nr:helix-turn-helix transcriptional regulator [Cryobacterium sp. 10I1]MEB0303851.1 helix-turn-helix transcriptional regulator [Cryobacterium sp. 10I1]